MLDSKPNTQLKILGIFFFLTFLVRAILSFYEQNPQVILWFCVTVLLLFSIGLYFNNLLIIYGGVLHRNDLDPSGEHIYSHSRSP